MIKSHLGGKLLHMSQVIMTIFLIITWPFLMFIGENLDVGIEVATLWPYYVVSILGYVLLFFALKRRNTFSDASILVALLLFSLIFFNFRTIDSLVTDVIRIFGKARGIEDFFGYVGVVALLFYGCRFGLRLSHDKQASPMQVMVVALSLMLLPSYQIATKWSKSVEMVAEKQKKKVLKTPKITPKDRPNVYFIITDAYARSDIMLKQFQYDNQEYLKHLNERGFSILSESMANFPMTMLSVPSTLNMKLIVKPGKDSVKGRLSFYKTMSGQNMTTEWFRGLGYTYAHFNNPLWKGTRCGDMVGDCIKYPKLHGLSETEYNFIALTPLRDAIINVNLKLNEGKPLISQLQTLQNWIETTNQNEKPHYMFAHITSPHPPNTYGSECQGIPSDGRITVWEKEPYLNQVRCIEKDVIKLVDAIKKANQKTPIIIVQSDHGPMFFDIKLLHLSQLGNEELSQRFSVFNAVSAPEGCQKKFYPSMSLVNTFRVVFSCLDDSKPSLLPDDSYMAYYEKNPAYGEVERISPERLR